MDMFQDLLSQQTAPQVSPEMLEIMGTKAAQLFLQNGVPLNDAIKQITAEDQNLGDEHLRRVVEFANNFAFQQMFEKSEDKNIHFDVADPAVIIRDLRDGGSPAHDGKPLGIGGKSDYRSAPPSGEDGMAELSQMFAPQPSTATAGAPLAKVASVEEPSQNNHSNPIDDVFDTNIKLRAAREHLAGSNEEHDFILKTAQEEFYNTVKNEVLNDIGAGLGGVVVAFIKLGMKDPGQLQDVLAPVIQRLVSDGISGDVLSTSLEKKAGKILNPQHPLITTYAGMLKAAEAKNITQTALKAIDSEIEKTAAFLKTNVKAI